MTKKTLVYIELENNKPAKVSEEIVAHIAHNFKDTEIYGAVIADENSINCSLHKLKSIGLDKLFIFQSNCFAIFDSSVFSEILSNLIKEITPNFMFMGATCEGRELAPRLASKLNIGLTADCTQLELDENANLLATRPTYGGKMMAVITSKTQPNFATVRQGAFKLQENKNDKETEIINKNPQIIDSNMLIEVLHSDRKQQVDDWTCSDVIIAGGLGLCTKENFELIYKLCELIGAKPAASRAVVERGWASQSIQVGQTGVSVSPKLYIALGISGALQHLSGISNADKIIAINTDIQAPIMSYADFAINTDAIVVLKKIINKLS